MRLEAFDRFERQEEGGVAAAVARVAAGGFDGGREGVGGPADYSPAFVANANDLAGLEGRGVRGHADASARRVPARRQRQFPNAARRSPRNLPRSDLAGSSVFAKSGDRRTEVRLGRIPEGLDQGVILERLLDDAPLNPLAAAMNEADLTEACIVCRVHVLFDDRLDVAWRKGVEIERAFDRDPVGHEAV